MRILLNTVIGLLTLLYPLAVYFGIRHFEPWMIAVLLIVLLALKLAMSAFGPQWNRFLWLAGLVYCGLAVWRNDVITLRFYPVMVNSVMLTIFSWSLWSPPTLVERLARMQHPDLPPEGVLYTRRVTQVWCLFFLINGSIALFTAIWSSFELWSLYNGLIAYVLMGALMAGEYLVRMKVQKHAR
jgi:uncharacterized membrane protein